MSSVYRLSAFLTTLGTNIAVALLFILLLLCFGAMIRSEVEKWR